MYYKITIQKNRYEIDGNLYELNLTTPANDPNDAIFRGLDSEKIDKTVTEETGDITVIRSVKSQAGEYTLKSVRVEKRVSQPNHIEVELTIGAVSFKTIAEIKESIRSRFIDAEVALSLIYSKVYDRDKELIVAKSHRVVGVILNNISKTTTTTTVSVKLDIYSPDKYATLNTHSEVFVGKQLGDIMTTSLGRFPYMDKLFDETDCISRSYNFYYEFVENKKEYTKVEGSEVADTKTGKTKTTYDYKVSKNNIYMPHIIPYSVQYNESTYAFLCRLCRRFGETLYFEDGKLRIGIHPNKQDATSLYQALESITFNERTDAQSNLYVGSNYMDATTSTYFASEAVDPTAESLTYTKSDATTNVINQEVGMDETYVDLLSSINTKWAEDNPIYDEDYLDYIGETRANQSEIEQDDRYDIVNNSLVYWPAIVVRLIYQILTFQWSNAERYGEFILENALSIMESYLLVGEAKEGYYEHVESNSYKAKTRYALLNSTTTQEQWEKETTNTDASYKGSKVAAFVPTTAPVESISDSYELYKCSDVSESEVKTLLAGVRYVDSPRGLAEIMHKSSFALSSFISKTSGDAATSVIKVKLQQGDDLSSSTLSIITSLRLGSVVILDKATATNSVIECYTTTTDRYVVIGISIRTEEGVDRDEVVTTNSDGEEVVTIEEKSYTYIVAELDLLPAVSTSYKKVLGLEDTTSIVDLEVAIPYFTQDDMIRRAEPQRAFVVDVSDSRKLNRARVCYPWQYATPGVKVDSYLTTITRDTDLAANLAKGASPWLRISTPGNNGNGGGILFAPELYTEVMVNYEAGNIERPYISGSLFSGPNGVLMGHALNDYSIMSTKYGRKVMLSDVAVGGQNAILSSFFPFTSYLDLDTSSSFLEAMDGFIQIGDSYGLCSINLSSTNRAVAISSPLGSVMMSALTGITIAAPAGDVNIVGKNVNITAENNLNLMSGTRVGRMRAAQAEYSGKSMRGKVLTALGGAAMGMLDVALGELIDLKLVRTLFECICKPVGGTMVIKSNRYLCIEGGKGRTVMPESTNNKCFISLVLRDFVKVFDPIDSWQYVRYKRCYEELREELIGKDANDKECLLFKVYGSGNALNADGTELRTYISDRLVKPTEFPPANNLIFDDADYQKFFKFPYDDDRGLKRGYANKTLPLCYAEFRFKLMMARHAYNYFKEFISDTSILKKRVDSISEKSGVTNGVKNLIQGSLFADEYPTYSDLIKVGVQNEYPLYNQTFFKDLATSKAARRIMLLILLSKLTKTIIERYDITNAADMTVDSLFPGFAAPAAPAAAPKNIRQVFEAAYGAGAALKGKPALSKANIAIVNRDWPKLCRSFTIAGDTPKSSTAKSYGTTIMDYLTDSVGLSPNNATGRDSIISWNKIKSDRRTSDDGAILITSSPKGTVKFNPQTASFEKVLSDSSPLLAALRGAMTSI